MANAIVSDFEFRISLFDSDIIDMNSKLTIGILSLLFFISGFAALIYQIVWQRVLFTAFGVNIESITLVVAVFMFGLGMGSLLGGLLSKWFPRHLPHLFLGCEILIGLFGLVSLPLIRMVSAWAIYGSLLEIGAAIYGLLCIPTLFMGATLPVLSTYLHRQYQNIGTTISTLYFVNTLGSAAASFVTANVLFVYMGLHESVIVAALCNFLTGAGVFLFLKLSSTTDITQTDSPTSQLSDLPLATGQFALVLILSAVVGYIALSQEILWFRALSFASGDHPRVFANALGSLLLGVALGAGLSRFLCAKAPSASMAVVGLLLGISAILYPLSLPLCAYVYSTSKVAGLIFSTAMVGVGSLFLGAVLPTLCHFAIRTGRAIGLPVSWIYFANIVGSTAGPLLTGFVLLDLFGLQRNVGLLTALTGLSAGAVLLAAPFATKSKTILVAGLGAATIILWASQYFLYDALLERLQFKEDFSRYTRFKYVEQNRSGIITVQSGETDIIYGGGVYDGRFNIDPVINSNYITRTYMAAALHPHPKKMLVIGLSSGSWVRALSLHDRIEKMTVVEINPAYTRIIKNYPQIAPILNDPKIELIVDDGRRWLNRHADERFDFILMNTSYHWRSMATNLLSDEFLRLMKAHLNPGGVIYYNTTSADDAYFTAAKVFNHVIQYGNFVGAGDNPFAMTPSQKKEALLGFRLNGESIFEKNAAMKAVLEELANADLVDLAPTLRKRKDLYQITDDNMAPEFKRGFAQE